MDADLFLTAQEPVWGNVQRELAAGRKSSHWMWFIFPQLTSLGRSATAKRFGLDDLDAATAFLSHPVLGQRLVRAASLLLNHEDVDAETIMGHIDALKLRSSMTLFEAVPGASHVFADVLEAFYRGERCPLTLAAIKG